MVKDKHYNKCHAYINRKHGKAYKCEHCKRIDKKRYEYALIKGRSYSKDINDYMQLCTSCHRFYDYNIEYKLNLSRARKGLKIPSNTGLKHVKSIPIERLDLQGNLIDRWESINQCSVNTGIKKQNILECLKGNINQIKGFKFKKL